MAVPLLVMLLFITLLGIPLGMALLALYPVLLLARFIVGVSFLARVWYPALKRPLPASLGGRMGLFALTLVAVMLSARVPLAGPLLVGLIALAGLGAGALEIYARRSGPGAPDAPVVPPLPTPAPAEPLPSPWARP